MNTNKLPDFSNKVKSKNEEKEPFFHGERYFLTYGKHLSDGAFRVYIALCSFSFPNETDPTKRNAAFPSLEKLCERSGKSRTLVNIGLAELLHFGWIMRMPYKKTKKGRYKPNEYKLTFPTLGIIRRDNKNITTLVPKEYTKEEIKNIILSPSSPEISAKVHTDLKKVFKKTKDISTEEILRIKKELRRVFEKEVEYEWLK